MCTYGKTATGHVSPHLNTTVDYCLVVVDLKVCQMKKKNKMCDSAINNVNKPGH